MNGMLLAAGYGALDLVLPISIAIVAPFVLAACQQQPNATPATAATHPSEYPLGWQPLEPTGI